jgi:HJR/Mrr/RecB family endonuclease
MSRRQQSKEFRVIEPAIGLAALVLFLYFFSPDFRAGIQILFAFVVIAFLVWLAFAFIKPEPPSPTFKTFTFTPHQNEISASEKRPDVFVEDLQPAKRASESNISENLRRIDWYQFEKLVGLIYQHRGFKVKRLGGANADGGVDLIVESPTKSFVVQCKHWRSRSVGVRHIREFLGTLTDSKIQKGIFITLAGYSNEARQLAEKHGIQILNEPDIIKMLENSGLIHSQEISRLFPDDRKICPKCENELVLRTNRQTGENFWGCSTFPRCRFKLNCQAGLKLLNNFVDLPVRSA